MDITTLILMFLIGSLTFGSFFLMADYLDKL